MGIEGGRSKQLCDEMGTKMVYLNFLKKIHTLIHEKRGKIMQFWGDIVLNTPEVIPLLPKPIVCLIWGYEANHSFDTQCKHFANHNIPFYVCPGTSSWNTFAGRTENCLVNLANAAVNGAKYPIQALGYFSTDWGDCGHQQSLSVSMLGFIGSALFSWNASLAEECSSIEKIQENSVQVESLISKLTTLYAFEGKEKLGEFAYKIGNAYLHTNYLCSNNSILFKLVIRNPDFTADKIRFLFNEESNLNGIKREQLESAKQYIEQCLQEYKEELNSNNSIEVRELKWAAQMILFACNYGIAVSKAELQLISKIEKNEKKNLAEALKSLREEFLSLIHI